MRVQIVSFRCVLKNNLGQFISSSTNQDVVTNQSEKDVQALPGFVEALKDLKVGDKKRISVPAEKAYGFYNPELQIQVPRSKLYRGKALKAEDQVTGQLTQDGIMRTFRVVSAAPRFVVLDGNHPLAGQDLVFDVEVTASREEQELEPVLNEYKSKTGFLN